MKKIKILSLVAILGCMLLVMDCSKDSAAPASLYTRLGGITAISAVVDQFLTNVVADNTINGRFSATVADSYRTQLLRDNLIDQICSASGGPCQYKGKTMMQAHAGMNITSDEFNALVADLVSALNTFKVSSKDQTDLLTILGGLESQIVGQ